MDAKLLIYITNKVEEALTISKQNSNKPSQNELDIPRIVVIGGQSAGKSSVLESIVGFDFLPRGDDIVTRRPLIIELVNNEDENSMITATIRDRHTTIGHQSNLPITEVRSLIQQATELHPGCKNNNISNDPIRLQIISPSLMTLTLVDLPGMTRVAIRRGQNDDISEQIESMVRHYIGANENNNERNKNTIILAVTPANQDLATSDAVRIARKVDPNGKRTIGVLTKVDIMDAGTEYRARDIMLDRENLFEFQWIPVKNRSQEDINKNKNVSEQRQEEKEFFSDWFPDDNDDLAEKTGVDYLTRILHTKLVNLIRKQLPHIQTTVETLHSDKTTELSLLKEMSDLLSFRQHAHHSIYRYTKQLESVLRGHHPSLTKASGGSEVMRLFREDAVFTSSIKAIDPLATISDDNILLLMENSRGYENGLFMVHSALKTLVRHTIDRILPIALSCVDDVCDNLKDQAQRIPVPISEKIQGWIHATTLDILNRWKKDCMSVVHGLILMERRVNPDHPDFVNFVDFDKFLKEQQDSDQVEIVEEVDVTDDEADDEEEEREEEQKEEEKEPPKKETPAERLRRLKDSRLKNNAPEEKKEEENKKKKSKTKKTKKKIVRRTVTTRGNDKLSSRLLEVNIMKDLLIKHCDIVKIKTLDSVPKAISFYLIDPVTDEGLDNFLSNPTDNTSSSTYYTNPMKSLQQELDQKLMEEERDDGLKDLMGFTDNDEVKLKDCEDAVGKLGEALEAIRELRKMQNGDLLD